MYKYYLILIVHWQKIAAGNALMLWLNTAFMCLRFHRKYVGCVPHIESIHVSWLIYQKEASLPCEVSFLNTPQRSKWTLDADWLFFFFTNGGTSIDINT